MSHLTEDRYDFNKKNHQTVVFAASFLGVVQERGGCKLHNDKLCVTKLF